MESEQTETFVFNIDRGGTFTDFYVQDILHNHVVR
jgi:N-methylhydantoinase A/oxoprolinase/acetone carboxylase beta subunit